MGHLCHSARKWICEILTTLTKKDQESTLHSVSHTVPRKRTKLQSYHRNVICEIEQ